ncbi:MAG: hypothetical protein HYX76_04165, partial [Acidobacteria bacterium]|nr:hypothetical protein [Acidobacteriota bacterium]
AGAQAPDVSPDGRTIVYVGYTVEGYDLFVMPIGREEWTAPGPPLPSASAGVLDPGGNRPSGGPARAPDPGEDRVSGRSNRAQVAQPYSPRGTLAPRYWLPEVEYGDNTLKIGALTSGFDVLGRHAYSTSAQWTNISGRPDWSAGYTYDRLWPTIFAVASSETSRLAGGVLREEAGEAGFSLPFRRVRQGQTVFASFRGQRNRFSCDETAECEGAPSQVRNAARLGWMFSSAREYGYSISAQDGFSVMVATEHVRRALGADGAADSATVEFRLFPRLGGRHSVLAVRGGAGFASGDRDVRRRFTAAGNGPKRAVLDFDSDAIGLLRGFHERDIVGDRAAVLNVDYRVPLVRIERGHGTWPLFLRTIHGSLFADVGNAWFGRSPWRALKSAIGAELSLDAVVGYYSPTTFAAGVAWRHDRSGQLAGGPAVYARIGRAF